MKASSSPLRPSLRGAALLGAACLLACEPLPTFLPEPLEPMAGSIEFDGLLMPSLAVLTNDGKLVLETINGEYQVSLEPQGFPIDQFPEGEIALATPTRAGARVALFREPTLPEDPPPGFNPDTLPWTDLNLTVLSSRIAMTQSTPNALQGWFDLRVETAERGRFRLRGRYWAATGFWQQCDGGRLIPAGESCTPGNETSR